MLLHDSFGFVPIAGHDDSPVCAEMQEREHVAGGKRGHQQFLGVVSGRIAPEVRIGGTGYWRAFAIRGNFVVASKGAIAACARSQVSGPIYDDSISMGAFHSSIMPGLRAACYAGGLKLLLRLLVLALAAALAPAAPRATLFDQVGPILADLSQITGWNVARNVPAQILSKQTFRHYMEARMKESNTRELRAEELTLKMFGLVPKDFNLAGETVDLMSEQAAAYYDYQKKRLFILDSTPNGEEQRMALVHELAHALADQHHALGKFIRDGALDDDAATARQAVMEGQANWLTFAYLSYHDGGKPEIPEPLLDQVSSSAGANGPEFPVYTSAPLYIRESLVFPYNQGTRFQDAIYRKLGRRAFDEVFTHPPQSTQQIMHPEEYFLQVEPSMPEPATLDPLLGKQAREFRSLTDGALGEFDFSALLRQYVGEREGSIAAAHIRGGAFRLYEHKRERYPVLACTTRWDSPDAARAYFGLYKRVLQGKWRKLEIEGDSGTVLSGVGDYGKFQVRLVGSAVESVEGMR